MTTEPLKVYCRSCGKPTNHNARSKPVDGTSSAASGGVSGESGEEYWIIACAGCNTVSFRELLPGACDKVVENLYPAPTIRKARDDFESPTSRVPSEIVDMYRATMSAFNSGSQNKSSFILCAGGIRCMLELICSDLRIEGNGLEAKIDGLNKAGHLTPAHTELLHDARFLGNDALHQGRVPAEATLDVLLKLFEDTVNDLYIRPERFNEGEMLDAEVIEVSDKGTVVRVGTSTRSMIPVSEGGGPPSDSASKAQKIGDRIKVKVLSGREAQLHLSKRAADAAIKKERDEQRQKAEQERAYWAAFKRIRRGDLLEGVVTRVFPEGFEIDVLKDSIAIPGWVPTNEYESERRREYRRRDPVVVYVLRAVPATATRRECVVVSHHEGIVETHYRRAEDAYHHGSVMRGLVTEVGKEGAKVHVAIGYGCVGQVLQSDLGAGYGDASRVGELLEHTIPVNVTNLPDPKRRDPLQLSHRSALERQQHLTELKKLPLPPPITGKVRKVFKWGAVVSINDTDGVMLNVDMAGQKLSEMAEIPIEIIRLDPQEGYLGLKAAFAAAVPASAAANTEAADDMADEDEEDESNLQHSVRYQADGNDPAERLNERENVRTAEDGPKSP